MSLEILAQLINHFVAIVNEGEQAMVIRKLASSLTTIFRHPKCSWKRAIWQLAASLAHGGYVSEEQAQTVNFLDGVLPALNTQQALALAFFSVALAEDGLRLEVEPRDAKSILERSQSNIEDGFLLVRYIMQQISNSEAALREDSTEVTLGNEAMGSWKVSQISVLTLIYFILYILICLSSKGLARRLRKSVYFYWGRPPAYCNFMRSRHH